MNNYLFKKWKKKFHAQVVCEVLFHGIIAISQEDPECRYIIRLAKSYGIEKELLAMLEEHWDNCGYPIEEYTMAMYWQNEIRNALRGRRKSIKRKEVIHFADKR